MRLSYTKLHFMHLPLHDSMHKYCNYINVSYRFATCMVKNAMLKLLWIIYNANKKNSLKGDIRNIYTCMPFPFLTFRSRQI